MNRVERIEKLLREKLEPVSLEVADESHLHRGHAGAASGQGHFQVKIAAEGFRGKTPIERHQMVYRALDEMMDEIHALAIQASLPQP